MNGINSTCWFSNGNIFFCFITVCLFNVCDHALHKTGNRHMS